MAICLSQSTTYLGPFIVEFRSEANTSVTCFRYDSKKH